MTEAAVPASGRDRSRRRQSLRGILVCLAMFALGGAVLWGLFQAPRNRTAAAPDVPWGAPMRPLRFVSMDFGGQSRVTDPLLKRLRELDPDYVLVQNIRFDDVMPLAEALGMARTYHPQLFQRADPRSKESPGDLILSKHSLFEAARLELGPDSLPDARGVQAVSVVDRLRFLVASGVGATDASRRMLDNIRSQTASPPIVVASGFLAGSRRGEGTYAGDLDPTVALRQETEQRGPIIPVAAVYSDKSWVMTGGTSIPPENGGPFILYVELKGWTPGAAAATKPGR